MKRYFDKKNNRLVFADKEATAEFWDGFWGKDFSQEVKGVSDNCLVVSSTKRFLPLPAKVLEGGCGRGQYVYALQKNGYDSYGVDYAPETIELINKNFPELKISLGDVRGLAFADNEFDGYWSLGVIEHFYDGYQDILREMARVIKPGGRLFLVFPAFSPFRRLRAKFGFYPEFKAEVFDQKTFYQFVLPYDKVVSDLEILGFELLFKKYTNGIKTFMEETLLGSLVAKNNLFKKVFKKIINPLSFFFGHTVLLVLEKK